MIGKFVYELPTPALLIDLDIMNENLIRAAQIAKENGKKLRPHIKAHKIPEFARMQISMGAEGICTAKVSEAEIMVQNGIEDILIANEIVGQEQLKRMAELAKKSKISVLADSVKTVELLAQTAEDNNIELGVLIEIDTGDERCGARPEDAPLLAKLIESKPRLHFIGIETFGGSVFHCENAQEEQRRAPALAELLRNVKQNIEEQGIAVKEVSVGGSPALELMAHQDGITELRPGVYIFNDGATVSRGGASFNNCAATVLTTIISVPNKNRMVVDGGAKTFSYCRPGIVYGNKIMHGVLRGRTDIYLSKLSEEHGVFETDNGNMDFSAYNVGDKIEVIPAHTCPVINLFDTAYLCKHGVVQAVIPIAARGKMQ